MAKILIVEDEEDLREVIVEELTDEGHSVVDAPGGQAALDRLANDSVDLIISDITMPEMNGYQFFRSLKETLPQHAQTPFIFMTALADRDSEIKGLRLGVDDYITKPIDFDVLFLRIETHLRRRPMGADAALPTAAPPDENDADPSTFCGDHDSAEKLSAILKENDGRLIASRFVTISLDTVRERVGDQWAEISDQILLNVEMVIRAHLGPKDSLCVKPTQDFMVCFAEPDQDQVAFKTSLIRDEIWEKLFSLTNDEELASVSAQSFALSVDPDDVDDDDILSDVGQLVDEKISENKEVHGRQLEQIYKYDELYALTLIGASGSPSKIRSISFKNDIMEKVRNFSGQFRQDSEFLLELQTTMFERLKEKLGSKKNHAKHALLLPVAFHLLCDPRAREGLTALCQDLEKSLELVLLIEIIDTPDRLKPHREALKPLPVGRQLQFIEIRRPLQADGIALDQLGVAYVSMSFNNVEASRTNGFVDFRKRLEGQGVKLYIKDIPEGRLIEAQRHKAGLLSMQR